jgi:hypothetical protein
MARQTVGVGSGWPFLSKVVSRQSTCQLSAEMRTAERISIATRSSAARFAGSFSGA